jgi:NADPH:quinone reductase-like Zn-dependent oxidoreductase
MNEEPSHLERDGGSSMMAMVFYEYGPPEVLRYEEVARPVAGPGEAIVRVRAVGINAADLMARAGRYKPNEGRFPHILGTDFGGEVVELGTGVSGPVQVGSRVTDWWVVPCGYCEQCMTGNWNRCALDYKYLGAHLHGAYAQYVKLPAMNLIEIPREMSFEEAAGFPNPYGTAWHMLVTRGHIRVGETILIQAAGSGVSVAGIQIAKHAGLVVIATAGSEDKLARARALGADFVINYREQNFREEVMKLTGKRGVDVVFEHVGGDVFGESIRSLTRGGRLLTCGGTAGYDVAFNMAHIFHKELTIIGSNSAIRQELVQMMPLVKTGVLKPIVDRIFPLDEAAEAHRYVAERSQFGKVVLVPE